MTTQDRYIDLFCSLAEASKISRRHIARQSDLHHSKVTRILDHGVVASVNVMNQIGKAVGADPLRAFIAIEVLGDQSSYFTPAVRVVSQLLGSLTKEMEAVDDHLFEGFVAQEFSSLTALILKTTITALERRERRFVFV